MNKLRVQLSRAWNIWRSYAHLPRLISARVCVCVSVVRLKRIRKDISASPFVPLFPPDPPLTPAERGGRSVRRNAALSSKAHRHSSPPLHRAKRRISVSLRPSVLPASPFYIPAIHLLEKWTDAEKSDGEVRATRKDALASSPAFRGTPINSVAPAKFEFFLL